MGPEMQVHTTVASPQPAHTDSKSANDMTLELTWALIVGLFLRSNMNGDDKGHSARRAEGTRGARGRGAPVNLQNGRQGLSRY